MNLQAEPGRDRTGQRGQGAAGQVTSRRPGARTARGDRPAAERCQGMYRISS